MNPSICSIRFKQKQATKQTPGQRLWIHWHVARHSSIMKTMINLHKEKRANRVNWTCVLVLQVRRLNRDAWRCLNVSQTSSVGHNPWRMETLWADLDIIHSSACNRLKMEAPALCCGRKHLHPSVNLSEQLTLLRDTQQNQHSESERVWANSDLSHKHNQIGSFLSAHIFLVYGDDSLRSSVTNTHENVWHHLKRHEVILEIWFSVDMSARVLDWQLLPPCHLTHIWCLFLISNVTFFRRAKARAL